MNKSLFSTLIFMGFLSLGIPFGEEKNSISNSAGPPSDPFINFYDGNNVLAAVGLGTKIAALGTKENTLEWTAHIGFNSAMGINIAGVYFLQNYDKYTFRNVGTIFYALGLISEYGFNYLEDNYKSFSWVSQKNKLTAVVFYTFALGAFARNTSDYKKTMLSSVNIGIQNGGPTVMYVKNF